MSLASSRVQVGSGLDLYSTRRTQRELCIGTVMYVVRGVVFLMWEVTLYVTLTVSASTRMDTLLQIANIDSSVLPIPLQARKSPRRPNNLDCSGGIWTQSFRQGHGNVDKVAVSCSLGAACHLR